MYGGLPFTPLEDLINKQFLLTTIAMSGFSREKAYENMLESGWFWYSQKNYKVAMKRFNQAWLINPKDPRVLNAYGAVTDELGRKQEAIKWYRQGAEKGDAKAQYNLAEEYFRGKTLKRNYLEAAKWYRKAADQNLNWALNMIGVCYEYGLGVPRSIDESRKWYKKADEKGGIEPKRLEFRGQTQIDEFEIPPEGQMITE